MDVIAAVSFAASILAFVDFSSELMTGALEVIRSGTTARDARAQMQASDVVKQLTHLRDYVLKSFVDGADQTEKALSVELSEQLRLVKDVRSSVNELLKPTTASSPSMRILKKLYFGTIYSRVDSVENPVGHTFEWVLGENGSLELREMSLCFFTWLRSGGGIFHLSGKPGSGKSTLMKQCPNLILVVFPDAYDAFSRSGPGLTLDEIFFRPEALERGIDVLMSKSGHLGYRMCLFIDSLGECGEDGNDSLDHEHLVEKLQLWAFEDNIKILVSSRPQREFEDALSDDRRIRLYQITELDISDSDGRCLGRTGSLLRFKISTKAY
ncbi:hypothetical protein B0H63DRAFT_446246 [Podospora didyma]|uniref:NACHT domain-containing protein n=1 Tax=Podospora didyma TaxID=330526 RepID=A0AAE0U414_9PEZI|nr:hypothetical protein B0H63DRAFT_446246 [Podospora didyma]